MKQPIVAISSVFALLSLGAVGCGDDDSSSSSGVDSKKLVSDVSDAEAQKVCRWLERESASINPTPKQLCTAGSIAYSSNEAQCNEFVTACVESGEFDEPADEEVSECDTASAADVDASCDTVTVGELEACAKALINGLNSSLSKLSCANAGEEVEIGNSTTPAACQKIEDDCPILFETIGGSDSIDVDGGTGTGGTGSGDDFACGNGESVDSSWVCDGEEDCANGKDELDC